jgi:hypothetical protein
MRSKKLNIPGVEGYRELLQTLELDGKRIEDCTMKTIERIDRMLDDDELFNRTNLEIIRSLARESIVDENITSNKSHLMIKCNERLEILVEHVKQEAFLFTEHAEKIHGLIDLNGINCEMQLVWKNELVQMQGQISSHQMDILNYYRNRSDIGINILKQIQISDYWTQLIEIDEDFFFKLRMILIHLRSFYQQLYQIVSHWIHFSSKIK